MAPPFRWDWVLAIGGLLGILRLLVPAWGYGMGDDGWEITASFPWEWAYEAESDYLLLANFAKYAVVGLLAFIFSFTPRGTRWPAWVCLLLLCGMNLLEDGLWLVDADQQGIPEMAWWSLIQNILRWWCLLILLSLAAYRLRSPLPTAETVLLLLAGVFYAVLIAADTLVQLMDMDSIERLTLADRELYPVKLWIGNVCRFMCVFFAFFALLKGGRGRAMALVFLLFATFLMPLVARFTALHAWNPEVVFQNFGATVILSLLGVVTVHGLVCSLGFRLAEPTQSSA